MSMSTETPAQRASRTLSERTTPQWRKERAQKAYLTGAVNAVVEHVRDLSSEQAGRIRAAFSTQQESRKQ